MIWLILATILSIGWIIWSFLEMLAEPLGKKRRWNLTWRWIRLGAFLLFYCFPLGSEWATPVNPLFLFIVGLILLVVKLMWFALVHYHPFGSAAPKDEGIYQGQDLQESERDYEGGYKQQ